VGLDTLIVQQGLTAHLSEAEIEPKPNFICEEFKW
jgi:hypothetical protein